MLNSGTVYYRSLLAISIGILLSACSSNPHIPAPVESVYRGKTIHNFKPNTLKQNTYTVEKGETLYSIAFRAGKDFRELAKVNKILPPYTVYPGQLIKLSSSQKTTTVVTKKPFKTKTSKKTKTIPKKSNIKPTKKVANKKSEEYVGNVASVNKELTSDLGYKKTIKWQWPTKGKILKKFSKKELGNKGLDIGGKNGSPIFAAADGKVVYAGNALRGYGNLIIVKHSEDFLSAYAHNSKLLVSEQSWVKAGQQIAEMGRTDSDNVKLHFEVRYKGTTVDPLRYLPKK
ncbi:hypothetical protein C2869_14600 [Saccharobesus litoralis]|uniref:LysM domain-containing protein n=1 Tax=Saccharobesus litoralis TaxID=2172099 RepID=A0A2S0VTQ1_9ALTE|nr:peptidoglycan DD-metalloendopeptidase family protein [Saccharobesus litoralis]AWB67594.1 hypothetical protein C2869_14600 [Saccharobesus litoralis]